MTDEQYSAKATNVY